MDSQFLFHQAVSLHQSGKLAQAQSLYKQVLEAEPGNYQAQYLLAFSCYQQQRGPEALEAVKAALRLNPDGVDAIMLRGALLLEAQQHEEALADFSRATVLKPDRAEAWHNRGIVLARLARPREAVAAFDRALAIRPGGQIWNSRGAALQELKRFEDALQCFDKALAATPGLLLALYNRGVVLLALKRSVEAVADFDRVLAQNPNLSEVWNNRGVALQELRRFADALASYDKALAIQPEYAASWSNRAALLQTLNRFEEAVASYDKALAIRPDNARDWINRAAALHGLKRQEDALGSYDKAIALLPDDAEAWCGRAHVLHALRRFPEIMASLDKALTIDPDYPPALSARAAFLCEVNRVAEGIAVYRRRAELVYRSMPGPATDDPAHKKRHDAEQRAYLAAKGVLLRDDMFHLADGERLAAPAVNSANAENIATQWRSSRPQIVVIDNLLTEKALENLRRFCWDSTIWRKAYKNGYLGAMPAHGFACPLLAQIAEELRHAYPSIFGEHGLTMFWAFKYDSDLGGIRIHADQAVVNVNFWITPDEANRNPENGGLVIWDAKAPSDWEITKYNGDDDAVRAFLAETGAKSTRVAYRANRAVIFDSDLFHETDVIEFEEGYLNRRINITLLYGRRPFDAG